MASITQTIYTCDNCDTTLPDGESAQTFRITYNHATHSVDLCDECATKVAWLHGKGTPVRTVGRPSKTTGTAKRGRPRKVAEPSEPTPTPPVMAGAKPMTLGELIEGVTDGGVTMGTADLPGDDGMGGTITAVPQPAFAAPGSDA